MWRIGAAMVAVVVAAGAARADEPRPAWLVAARADAGAYARAELQAGWGVPHASWGGLSVVALSTFEMGMLEGSARLDLPYGRLWAGGRALTSYLRGDLPVAPSHEQAELDAADGPATMRQGEVGLMSGAPLPLGALVVELTQVWTTGVGGGRHAYDEYARLVIGAGRLGIYRASWLVPLGRLDVAPVLELLEGGDRAEATWRVGLFAQWKFSARFDAILILTTPVASPDDLDLMTGAWGTAGVRYRFTLLPR